MGRADPASYLGLKGGNKTADARCGQQNSQNLDGLNQGQGQQDHPPCGGNDLGQLSLDGFIQRQV